MYSTPSWKTFVRSSAAPIFFMQTLHRIAGSSVGKKENSRAGTNNLR
jgi:hypothetical protein